MSEEKTVSWDEYNRVRSLLTYYKNKDEQGKNSKSRGRQPKPGVLARQRNTMKIQRAQIERLKHDLSTSGKETKELFDIVDRLESDCALLVSEVIAWRAAFIRQNVDLDIVQDPPLQRAIWNTDGRLPNGNRTNGTSNPIMRNRRSRDTDSLSAECKSLLPKVPKPSRHREARSRVSEISLRDSGTDDSAEG